MKLSNCFDDEGPDARREDDVVASVLGHVTVVARSLGEVGGVDIEVVVIALEIAVDAAEDVVKPIMPRPQVVDRASLTLGYAGVYSSFLLHTYRAAAKFNVEPRDILVELGKRKVVGGQEDYIIDLAAEMAQAQEAAKKNS